MSKYLPAWMKPKPVDMGDYRTAYKVKIKFGMLGPVSSGKSTIAAGFLHTVQTLSSLVPNFYCRVLPTSTHILAEAGFLICEHGWREKKVQVPICDVAGEISDYIEAKASGFTAGQVVKQRLQSINRSVVETVKDCKGFIIALAAPEALMFRESASTFDPDVYTHTASTFDPDVYTHTVMNEILEYRRRNKKDDPHVLVVLTKWDEVRDEAKSIQMDAYNETEDGMAKFLANGFPATSMLLKPLRDKGMVRFFRSWFNIKKREDGSKEYWPDTKKPVIELIEDETGFIRFRPAYAEEDYVEMVRYIGSFGQ